MEEKNYLTTEAQRRANKNYYDENKSKYMTISTNLPREEAEEAKKLLAQNGFTNITFFRHCLALLRSNTLPLPSEPLEVVRPARTQRRQPEREQEQPQPIASDFLKMFDDLSDDQKQEFASMILNTASTQAFKEIYTRYRLDMLNPDKN